MPDSEKPGTVSEHASHPGPADYPPPAVRSALGSTNGAIATTLLGLIAVLLGCLLLASEILTYLGLLLLIIALVLELKARRSLVTFMSHPGPADVPPPR